MDGDLEPNWPDAERRLRTFDSEEDESPEGPDPRRTKAMALTKHLQQMVQYATHKCCLAGKLPEVARARLLHEIELRVTAATSGPVRLPLGCYRWCGGPSPTFGLTNPEGRWLSGC
jgi:hypothetical protein